MSILAGESSVCKF